MRYNSLSMPRIRIDEQSLATLRDLAGRQGQTVQTVLRQAIENYRREKFLEDANTAFAALRSNADAWNEEKQERDLWDQTASDR